jgi:tetratricopeptide (TPR) repeat protein
MKIPRFLIRFLLLLAPILLVPGIVSGQATFMMGEDVLHPSGLVLTVNEIRRNNFAGGLGGKGKQDEIRLNLTMVNTGVKTYRIDPEKDFFLELGSSYDPQHDPEGRATRLAFNVYPSTQSRVNLYFKVPAEDTQDPILFFKFDDSEVKVYCSSELETLAKRSESQTLSVAEAYRLAQFYVDSGRFSAAKAILEPALQLYPGDNQLLMLMAAVHQGYQDNQSAMECLERVNPAQITTFKDAITLANTAMNLGHYHLAAAVLEPYELINKLEPENRILLARAYYYQDNLDRAERILDGLIRESVQDRMIYFTLGNIKDRQNQLREAIPLWEKAIEVDPDYCEAYFNIGVVYYKQENIQKAREYWQKVLLLRPDSHILRATEDALSATEF